MPVNDFKAGVDTGQPPTGKASLPDLEYRATFVETPFVFVSVFRQIRDWWREPRITVPQNYYRGETTLPVVEMRPWYRDIPNQIKALFEKPNFALLPESIRRIVEFNRRQEKNRVLVAAACAAIGAALGAFVKGTEGMGIGIPVGYITGYLAGIRGFKKLEEFPDIWQDYKQQPASWFNSILVHTLGLAALFLPFIVQRMLAPAKAASKYEVYDISPYLADLAASDKKAGGGGGGGDRSPTPASKGAVPEFAKEQLAPPMAVLPNLMPKLPAQPTLVGPPELKLPQMQANILWGDPQSLLGPASNGPGTGGGLGDGEGTGIGPGRGGGLGPGAGGGAGGGVYSVGGNVLAPIPIYKPEPPYSEEARKAKYQGTVVLWIVVDAQGNVSDVRVVKPLGLGLDEKAVETVRTWKFKAAMRNNIPVPVRVLVEVSFRLF